MAQKLVFNKRLQQSSQHTEVDFVVTDELRTVLTDDEFLKFLYELIKVRIPFSYLDPIGTSKTLLATISGNVQAVDKAQCFLTNYVHPCIEKPERMRHLPFKLSCHMRSKVIGSNDDKLIYIRMITATIVHQNMNRSGETEFTIIGVVQNVEQAENLLFLLKKWITYCQGTSDACYLTIQQYAAFLESKVKPGFHKVFPLYSIGPQLHIMPTK